MLYYLLYPLHKFFSFLNIFRYITFRAAMAAITAFLFCLIFGRSIIKILVRLKIGENVRVEDSRKLFELQQKKQNTPTMGGLMILSALFVALLLWSEFLNFFIMVVSLVTLWLGLTGFRDDYLKLKHKRSKGLSARAKLLSQTMLGIIVGCLLFIRPGWSTSIDVPFLKDIVFHLGIFYIIFVVIVIAGSSNAVNLTDGLDGLAIGIVIMVSIAYAVLSYVSGNMKFSDYLFIPYLPGSGELTVFCSALIGAGLGFLWYNCYPASVFMGDVGSLALGGALGTVALLIKKELLLVIVGGIFVVEALSVILQIVSFRFFKKRIFKIAPIHHHFQFMGWPESKVIVRFWILASLLALFALITLKIR